MQTRERRPPLNRVYLLDYSPVDIEDKQSSSGLLIKDKEYMAKETVFMDFDIIQITFNRDGVYTVIPVVANPINIVGAITPSVEFEYAWWIWLIFAVVVILVLLVLSIFIKPIAFIISLVFKILLFPFNLIGKLFKAIFKKRGSGGNG